MRLTHGLVAFGALLIGAGIGYWARRPGASPRHPASPVARDQNDGWARDEAPHATTSLGVSLTDGEWWTHENGVAIMVRLERGEGRGVVARADTTEVFGIRLARFDFPSATVEFAVEHGGEVSTWLATIDVGDPEAPMPTDDQLEAERHKPLPMTVNDVHGRFCAGMAPFKLWRKYDGGEADRVDRLRRLVALAVLESKLRFHGFREPAEVERLLAELRVAARKDDRRALANAIHYPFTTYDRGSPVREYAGPADILADYGAIFSASVLDALRESRYEALFVRDQGAMVGDGEVWLLQYDDGVKIKAINSPR